MTTRIGADAFEIIITFLSDDYETIFALSVASKDHQDIFKKVRPFEQEYTFLTNLKNNGNNFAVPSVGVLNYLLNKNFFRPQQRDPRAYFDHRFDQIKLNQVIAFTNKFEVLHKIYQLYEHQSISYTDINAFMFYYKWGIKIFIENNSHNIDVIKKCFTCIEPLSSIIYEILTYLLMCNNNLSFELLDYVCNIIVTSENGVDISALSQTANILTHACLSELKQTRMRMFVAHMWMTQPTMRECLQELVDGSQ